MDKNKEIEEMARDLPFLTLERDVHISSTNVEKRAWTLSEEDNKIIAEALYNAGYRKISEDNICEAVEKPVNTPKRKYESIDDIVRGFVVKDGKLMYVTNILDGCRHEFKDIYEICDELNNNMKEIDRLMELNNHLRFQLEECKKSIVKEFAKKLKNVIHERDYVQGYAEIGLIEEIDELLKEYEQ